MIALLGCDKKTLLLAQMDTLSGSCSIVDSFSDAELFQHYQLTSGIDSLLRYDLYAPSPLLTHCAPVLIGSFEQLPGMDEGRSSSKSSVFFLFNAGQNTQLVDYYIHCYGTYDSVSQPILSSKKHLLITRIPRLNMTTCETL